MDVPGINALTRRGALKVAAATGLGLALPASLLTAAETAAESTADKLITKPIPSTGERLPVIGLGTNSFTEAATDELRRVLQRFTQLGATMVDTAAVYGESEQVIGKLTTELKLRERLFIATKFMADEGRASAERSLQRLQTDHLDVLYVHSLHGTAELMPMLVEWKQAKKIRYIGLSAFTDDQHAQMAVEMKKYPVDIVQVNYGLGGRAAEQTVLKTAAERRIAVVANVPFGGRGARTLQAVMGKPLPPWAAEIGCASWAQLMLKYSFSHPAVTCVISGSTKVAHVDDNQQAGRGVVPDAAQRQRMEQYWDALG